MRIIRIKDARGSLALAAGAAAVLVVAFTAVSARLEIAHRGHGLGPDAAPPFYAVWAPRFWPIGLVAVALAVVAAAGARLAGARATRNPVVFLTCAIVFMVAFAGSVALIDGKPGRIVSTLERARPPDYQTDVHLLRELGVRGFVRAHPDLTNDMTSVHSKSHPPGPLLLLNALEQASPSHLVPRAIALGLLGALVLGGAWIIANRVGNARAAVVAVMLLAVAPGPILYAFNSLDTVFAAALGGAAALVVVALRPKGKPIHALAAGFAIGLCTFLTYAVVFVTLFAIVVAFMRLPVRDASRALALAALGGVAALLVLRLVFGFDLFASYRASYEALRTVTGERSLSYWLFGNPIAWLTFAGLPVAALATRELIARRAWYLFAMFLPLAVFYVLPVSVSHIIPGELERTLQFAYPLAAAAAGVAFVRWEEQQSAGKPRALAVLMLVTALQTILMEALLDIPW